MLFLASKTDRNKAGTTEAEDKQLKLLKFILHFQNYILGISICLENIDSNKIRGEGVYNNLGPLRSYILQLFSDALPNSAMYGVPCV